MINKIIVGIETSCDDTCVGVLRILNGKPIILANLKVNQNILHGKYGGIVPEVAARSHVSRLPHVFREALTLSKISIEDIDLICYTAEPGLLGSLLVGEKFAKGLGTRYNLPTKGINHLKAHGLSPLLEAPITPPFLSLIISGGHTELLYFENINSYEVLEKTSDDALGELFDKVGRTMGLAFPAGPLIEEMALRTQEHMPISLPSILSFSGLKTKFMHLWEQGHKMEVICNSMQMVVADMLIRTINKYAQDIPLLVGGGVAANKYIQRRLKAQIKDVYFPSMGICTDNGIMVAWCGYLEVFNLFI